MRFYSTTLDVIIIFEVNIYDSVFIDNYFLNLQHIKIAIGHNQNIISKRDIIKLLSDVQTTDIFFAEHSDGSCKKAEQRSKNIQNEIGNISKIRARKTKTDFKII